MFELRLLPQKGKNYTVWRGSDQVDKELYVLEPQWIVPPPENQPLWAVSLDFHSVRIHKHFQIITLIETDTLLLLGFERDQK